MTHRFIRLSTAAVLACVLASPALAQGTGRITGRVTDRESGQPIDAAQIRIDGSTIGAATTADGNYSIPRIAPGTYQLMRVTFPLGVIPNVINIADVGPTGPFSSMTQSVPDAVIEVPDIPEPTVLGVIALAALGVARVRREASGLR